MVEHAKLGTACDLSAEARVLPFWTRMIRDVFQETWDSTNNSTSIFRITREIRSLPQSASSEYNDAPTNWIVSLIWILDDIGTFKMPFQEPHEVKVPSRIFIVSIWFHYQLFSIWLIVSIWFPVIIETMKIHELLLSISLGFSRLTLPSLANPRCWSPGLLFLLLTCRRRRHLHVCWRCPQVPIPARKNMLKFHQIPI